MKMVAGNHLQNNIKMNKILNVLSLILIASCLSCNSDLKKYNNYFISVYSGKRECKIEIVELEEIKLDSNEFSSFEGSCIVKDSNIIFLDKRFCKAYVYDKNGTFITSCLGQGRAPFELSASRIEFSVPFENKFVFFGSDMDVHIHDSDWNRISTRHVNYNKKGSNQGTIDPDKMDSYTPHYGNLYARVNSKKEMFMPVYSECKSFGILSGENYYMNGRILIKYDLTNNEYKGVYGRISPEYKKRLPKILPYHLYYDFDIDKNDNFFVSYEIDSLIYKYGSDFKLKNVFGASGRKMDTTYQEVKLPIRKKMNPDLLIATRSHKGFYTHIEYFDEYDLLFRSYTKGGALANNGLQIFKGTTLVGDIEVPKGVNWVKGCIPPFFYTNVVLNDEEESMKIYRFKLPESILN